MQIKMKNICVYRFFFVTLRDFVNCIWNIPIYLKSIHRPI